MKNILRKFIYFVLILSLAIPVSTVFEAITFNEVYAEKKERKKPPKARRTQTLSKKVGTDFLKAQEALAEEKPDESLKILDRLLSNQELSDFEKATIYRLKGYVYAEKEDYPKSMDFLQQSLSYNALEPQAQLDLQFGIAQLYLAIDQWNRGLKELLDWFDNAEALGSPPGPSAHALLAQIYLYFASEAPKDSPEEKQFYRKAEPHAEIAVLQAAEPRENWYQIYLSVLLFDDRYEESVPLLEAMVYRFPDKKTYYRQLAALYAELKREEDSFAIQQIMYSKDMLEKHSELLRLAQLYLYYEIPYKAAIILEKELQAERIEDEEKNWEQLANAWLSAREWKKAIPPLTKAAEMSEDGRLFLRLGQTYMQEEDWKNAEKYIRYAIKKGDLENPGRAWLLLGITRNKKGIDFENSALFAFKRSTGYEDMEADARRWVKVIETKQARREADRLAAEAAEAELADDTIYFN
ncbi:MAG: hypothetical protein VX172_03645 [Pseudomonadota bacterium]|nr:hypothetical protein [Pseudomonadota bacterium]MEC8019642.1 hypothetical protein [Pseudomonadota bacterium]MEC8797100.1 hypothetical protein [Pseudomonadota bacterium]|tara:strand:- start:1546 stop:2946 length:1401 start_codon:yes stop_codon:yes gene_type:complete